MIKTNIPQAQLLLGSSQHLTDVVITFLQEHICLNNGCLVCVTCQQIRKQQHPDVVWILPEKTYTLETLAIIQELSAYSTDRPFFFVIQKADFLTTQCSNSLLKTIEEPPQGYHFILCAERKEYILPTIVSRCIIRSFIHNDIYTAHKTLYAYFTADKAQDPLQFLKEIQQSTITEPESLNLIDQLLAYWTHKYNLSNETPAKMLITKKIHLFEQALLTAPMSGSSKLFWKNLFLQYHAISHIIAS